MATVQRTPDAELLTRLRRRDRTAWEELYATYQPRLRGFAYRLSGNVHDADDLVQETFLRAVPRLDKLDPESADVSAYLFTTMRNLHLKQVERTKRAQPMAEVPEPAVPAPIEDDPVRSTLLERQQQEVRVANARLQPRQRLVLALRELEERSYAEIGELVGMKENAVAQLIFRARESLRTELRLMQVDPEQLPEECRRFLPLLAAHLDGQLKGAKLDETLAHLESCARCQASLADMREASRRYRMLIPPVAVDESREPLDERLTAAGYWETGRLRRLASGSTKLAAVALGALLLAIAGTTVGVTLSQGEPVAGTLTPLPPEPGAAETSAPRETSTQPTEPTTPTATIATTETTETQTTETQEPTPTTDTETAQPTETQPPETTAVEPTPTTTRTTTEPPADTTAPAVRITKAPTGATASETEQIAFTASEKNVTFSCRVDAGQFAPCASPVSLSGLAAGAHTFAVRARDAAGNVGKPATVTWTYTPPDTTPPVTTITSAPPASTTRFDATFAFTSNEPGSNFECALDGTGWVPCSGPRTYQRVPAGTHTFSVRATDQAGNVGAPASHTWTIVIPRPDLVITAFSRFSITVTNRGTATAGPSLLTISNVGTFKVPSLAAEKSATFSWSTCRVAIYTAVADSGQAVVESDEKNNTATLKNTCSRA
jgi:RNA polymerase sigma factor (sigma-70 family)